MDKQIVVYKGADDVRLEVQTDGETVWLTQEQMCRLFGRDRSVITNLKSAASATMRVA